MITYRLDKGIALTHEEGDNNLRYLDKKLRIANRAPTATDDELTGVKADESAWLDFSQKRIYLCKSATANEAVWEVVLSNGLYSDQDIKEKYERNADTNAFSDSEKTKLENLIQIDVISDVGDVTITTPTDGQILSYDATNNEWINANQPEMLTTLAELSDSNITTPTEGQILAYDATTSKWENIQFPTLVTSMVELNDTNITTPTEGQALYFNAVTGKWENSDRLETYTNITSLNDTNIVSLADGQILVYDLSTNRWINANQPEMLTDLTSLQDTEFTEVKESDVLVYNQTDNKWMNSDILSSFAKKPELEFITEKIEFLMNASTGIISVPEGCSGEYVAEVVAKSQSTGHYYEKISIMTSGQISSEKFYTAEWTADGLGQPSYTNTGISFLGDGSIEGYVKFSYIQNTFSSGFVEAGYVEVEEGGGLTIETGYAEYGYVE